MGLSTFSGPFSIWNFFYNFYVKRIKPPPLYYAARHFQTALSEQPGTPYQSTQAHST